METNTYDLPALPHGRLTPEQQAMAEEKFPLAYKDGASIRDIAQITGRSYGFVHKLLTGCGVTLNRPGGDVRAKKRLATVQDRNAAGGPRSDG